MLHMCVANDQQKCAGACGYATSPILQELQLMPDPAMFHVLRVAIQDEEEEDVADYFETVGMHDTQLCTHMH